MLIIQDIIWNKGTTQPNYIHIRSLYGCYSNVGMIGGKQELSLRAGGCTFMGTAAHELIHALGFYHEQSRADRDNYLRVFYENVDPCKYRLLFYSVFRPFPVSLLLNLKLCKNNFFFLN